MEAISESDNPAKYGYPTTLLDTALDLENLYPLTWERKNVDSRVRLYSLAVDNIDNGQDKQLNVTLSVLPVGGSDGKFWISVVKLDVLYEYSLTAPDVAFAKSGHNLLSSVEILLDYGVDSFESKIDSSSRRNCFDDTPNIEAQSYSCWIGLAQAFEDRWEHTGNPIDSELQLACATRALRLLPSKPSRSLLFIGSALLTRYLQHQQDSDLKSALTMLRYAQNHTKKEFELNSMHLYQLGRALAFSYEKYGIPDELDTAAILLSDALRFATDTHHRRCYITYVLARAHSTRLLLYGRSEDEDARRRFVNETVSLCPVGHIYRAHALQCLGDLLLDTFLQSQDYDYLDQTIQVDREGLDTCPSPKHPIMHSLLGSLCNKLRMRFDGRGQLADLNDAITHGRHGLELNPGSGPLLSNLGIALIVRFRELGNVDDLEEVVQLARRTLDICRPGHYRRGLATNNLGTMLIQRSEQSVNLDDINEGILLLRESASLRPHGHPEWARTQFNLADAIRIRYERSSDINDLEDSLALAEASMSNYTDADRTTGWSREQGILLAAMLRHERFKRLHNLQDLNFLILEFEAELHGFKGEEQFWRLKTLWILAMAYTLRAERYLFVDDAHMAMSYIAEGLDLAPPGHIMRASFLMGLTSLYLLQALPERSFSKALVSYCESISDIHCSPQTRLEEGVKILGKFQQAAKSETLDELTEAKLLEAYRLTINLLPQIAYFGLNAQARFRVLTQAPTLAAEASGHALRISRPTDAIEVLEEGRAVFWTQCLRLRLTFNGIPNSLAEELEKVARDLENNNSNLSESIPSREDKSALELYEQQLAVARRLSQKFDALVARARLFPGLERFMLSDTYSTLSKAAQMAPVVIFILAGDVSRAILIRDSNTKPEQLTFGHKISSVNLNSMRHTLYSTRQLTRGAIFDRGMKKSQSATGDASYQAVLVDMWSHVMRVVVQALGYKKATGRERPRVVFCATGQFSQLPLHAAGTPEEGCRDYFVPSYTPTLGALLSARASYEPVQRKETRILLAAVPRPFKWTWLNETTSEIELLRSILPPELITSIPNKPTMKKHRGASASATEVLDHLPEATVLHLACHGHSDTLNPVQSGFVMSDKMLTLTQLMALNLPRAFFAFLSACETAKTAEDQPDQAVHLAATMLFMGFKSVIGTMWSMGDVDGPIVAKRVYEMLFAGDSEYLDPDSIPYALDAAIEDLRRRKLHPSRWAPYVHFGI